MLGRLVVIGIAAASVTAALVGPATAAPAGLVIGTGAKTCVLQAGADCRDVVHRGLEFHGNLKGRIIKLALVFFGIAHDGQASQRPSQ